MRDPEEATDGPPDPGLDPEKSPGFDSHIEALEDIEVSRDVVIGEADPADLSAADTAPLAGTEAAEKVELLRDGSPKERQRAALSLAEGDGLDAVLAALARAATTDEDADVRQFAVEALGKLGGEVAAETARVVTEDADPWVRAEAYVALDRLDREAFADDLEAALDDDHHAVRRNAAISLFKLRGEAALDPLLDLADDPSERVREWAAHLLAGIDDERAETALQELASDDSEPEIVRSTAARALEADPGAFRRQFTGALDPGDRKLPGEDRLNRRPDL
jgi:HEAT repeat protein